MEIFYGTGFVRLLQHRRIARNAVENSNLKQLVPFLCICRIQKEMSLSSMGWSKRVHKKRQDQQQDLHVGKNYLNRSRNIKISEDQVSSFRSADVGETFRLSLEGGVISCLSQQIV